MAEILGIHGVGNYDRTALTRQAASENLTVKWSRALGERLSQPPDLTIAYYADLLRRHVVQAADDPLALGEGAAELLRSWMALALTGTGSQGPATAPIRILLGIIAERWGLGYAAVQRFVARFFSEVDSYLNDPVVRGSVQAEISRMLDTHRPKIVIAHSLGSVVTYEVLRDRQDLSVEALVTVGSPLAMPDVILQRLEPPLARLPACALPNVGTWVNVADIGDLIALPRLGLRKQFGVHHDIETAIGLFDFHRAVRYLGSEHVANSIQRHR